MNRKNVEISTVSCVPYTNKNRVYDRQSLSAPAFLCGILFGLVVLLQQNCKGGFSFRIRRRYIQATVEVENRFSISPQCDLGGSAFLISKNGRLLIVFHPVVKSACSYLNCSFCPHCFFLRFSLFLPLGMMYITITAERSQRNSRHILHKDESRKLCMIPTQKTSPTLPCVGRL